MSQGLKYRASQLVRRSKYQDRLVN